MTEQRYSPDGRLWFNEETGKWVPAYSLDDRFWWSGTEWVHQAAPVRSGLYKLGYAVLIILVAFVVLVIAGSIFDAVSQA